MTAKPLPTQARLNEVLRYDPNTGKLFWKARPLSEFTSEHLGRLWNSRYANQEAFTSCNNQGYHQGALNGKTYSAARIAWKIMTGADPDCIDHINGRRTDNSWENLRSVTRSENQRNLALQARSKSGITGVYWSRKSQKWVAYIRKDSRHEHLGLFDNLADAVLARKRAEAELGYHPNHGRAPIKSRKS